MSGVRKVCEKTRKIENRLMDWGSHPTFGQTYLWEPANLRLYGSADELLKGVRHGDERSPETRGLSCAGKAAPRAASP